MVIYKIIKKLLTAESQDKTHYVLSGLKNGFDDEALHLSQMLVF